jgi:hypothetical protein
VVARPREAPITETSGTRLYGRAMGAVINASTRRGTYRYHGPFSNFLRNASINAVGFFKPTGDVKPIFI